MTRCIHDMDPDLCGLCAPRTGRTGAGADRRGEYGFHGGATKAELLAEVCTVLGIPRAGIGVGSSLPSHVFDEAARQVGVAYGSMPEIGEAVARRAGLAWTAACDSRGSVSGGGSTVTREGLTVLLDALRRLL